MSTHGAAFGNRPHMLWCLTYLRGVDRTQAGEIMVVLHLGSHAGHCSPSYNVLGSVRKQSVSAVSLRAWLSF